MLLMTTKLHCRPCLYARYRLGLPQQRVGCSACGINPWRVLTNTYALRHCSMLTFPSTKYALNRISSTSGDGQEMFSAGTERNSFTEDTLSDSNRRPRTARPQLTFRGAHSPTQGPLSVMACEKSPWARGDTLSVHTADDPLLWPTSVTRVGSPPKRPMCF